MEHTYKECNCKNEDECMICRGFVYCSVCNAWEGEIPSHCVGDEIGWLNKRLILKGDIDFVNGKWIEKNK